LRIWLGWFILGGSGVGPEQKDLVDGYTKEIVWKSVERVKRLLGRKKK
jgi:hypothetical protein